MASLADAAWEELYAAYGRRLRAFALRLTRDPHEADEARQVSTADGLRQ